MWSNIRKHWLQLSGDIVVRCQRFHSSDVRVRFAPSPTGMLHLGGLRTALYNYLFARSRGGSFILRIEDTDQTRLVPGALENLQEMLHWAGIQIDEGPTQGGKYGPYVQSHRKHIYLEKIKDLIKSGHAYHCFCSQRRLDLIRKDAKRRRENVRYDGRCRQLSVAQVQEKLQQGQPHVIRFKLGHYKDAWSDIIMGRVTHDIADTEGDPVLIKSDKLPTYHFANVVDDHLMEVTHVLRGQEWQVSTTKHLLLYQAFGWTPPQYGHLPLIYNTDGTKLSKRQNDIHVESFKKRGFFPEAVICFLSTMGGGFSVRNTENLDIQQLVDRFSVNQLLSSPSQMSLERALQINKVHLHQHLLQEPQRSQIIKEVQKIVADKYTERMAKSELQDEIMGDAYIGAVLDWAKDRIYLLEDLLEKKFEFVWLAPSDLSNTDLPDVNQDIGSVLQAVLTEITAWTDEVFTLESINLRLREFSKQHKIKYAPLMKLLRITLSGLKEGPSIGEMINILGRSGTLLRLKHGIQQLSKQG